ncbi:serine/threonine-protein kinase HSL1, negative regulator of Swe1 kinase, partial [Tremellales sp. Uapishka_1]
MSSVAHRQGEHPTRQPSTSRQAASERKRMSGSSAGRDDAKMIGQWRIGRTIGKGSSGRVKIAKHAITQKYAAIKIVPKGLILSSRMSMSEAGARADKVLLGIEREIVIMKLIDHPNVLNLYDVWETSTELYLIMEYVPGGELFDYLVKRGRLPVSEALHYFQQIIHAVDYCHRFNICHRDLKPENLLLDKDKNIKVADFGMAAWEAGERMLETSCGSPHYASPEIVAGKAYHGSSSDIWSCGIILFALLTGRLPFDDDNIRSLLQKVKTGVFEMPSEIQGSARDLLKKMLEKDPERRITMPDILVHPFFTSRPPRGIPGRSLVSPPALNEVERPVNSPADIDADIMGNLKTLWHGAAEDEIIAALMSREKTWEKAIYHLLIKYRNKHLENYNMDEEDEAEARARKARRGPGPSPAKRKGGPPPLQLQERLAPLGENDTIQHSTSPPPSRPQAPTPKKASGQTWDESPRVTKLAPPRSPAGPRPPLSPRGSSYVSAATTPTTPSINVQEATPIKELVMGPPIASSSRPTSEILSTSTEAPQLPPLNVPRVHDAHLQLFFNEVASQLNTMNIRSSVASGSSSASNEFSPIQAYMAYASSAPPTTPMIEDPNQFADADDDQTEAMSVVSEPYRNQQSPLVGLGLGGPPPPSRGARPGLHPAGSQQNQNRWSVASSGGSSQYRGASGGSYASAPMESPGLYAPPQFEAANHHALQATRAAPAPPPRKAPPRPMPATPVLVESTLQRESSYVVIDHADMPSSDVNMSSWGSKQSGFSAGRSQDGFGMLKKKKKGTSFLNSLAFSGVLIAVLRSVTIDPIPYSSDLQGPSSAGSTSSPKRSWFNNLFSFKPATCTLLSHDNIGNTRDKAKRLLVDLGVRVAIVEVDGLRALKCRLDEVRDLQGVTTITKGVRFKVEFTRATQSGGGGYNTLVSLTQEKGAMSSFKGIFNKLRQDFEGSSSSPITPTAQSFTLPSARPQQQSPVHLIQPPLRYTASAPNSPLPPSTPRFAPAPATVHLPSSIRF